MFASWNGHIDIVEELLERGADLHSENKVDIVQYIAIVTLIVWRRVKPFLSHKWELSDAPRIMGLSVLCCHNNVFWNL